MYFYTQRSTEKLHFSHRNSTERKKDNSLLTHIMANHRIQWCPILSMQNKEVLPAPVRLFVMIKSAWKKPIGNGNRDWRRFRAQIKVPNTGYRNKKQSTYCAEPSRSSHFPMSRKWRCCLCAIKHCMLKLFTIFPPGAEKPSWKDEPSSH